MGGNVGNVMECGGMCGNVWDASMLVELGCAEIRNDGYFTKDGPHLAHSSTFHHIPSHFPLVFAGFEALDVHHAVQLTELLAEFIELMTIVHKDFDIAFKESVFGVNGQGAHIHGQSA